MTESLTQMTAIRNCSCLSDGSAVRPKANVSRKRKGPTFVTEEVQHPRFVFALTFEASRVETYGASQGAAFLLV
jgi:hypothetical protein